MVTYVLKSSFKTKWYNIQCPFTDGQSLEDDIGTDASSGKKVSTKRSQPLEGAFQGGIKVTAIKITTVPKYEKKIYKMFIISVQIWHLISVIKLTLRERNRLFKILTWIAKGKRLPLKNKQKMQQIAFLVSSLLYFCVLPYPKPDPDYLFIHLHSNRSTGGEVRGSFDDYHQSGGSGNPPWSNWGRIKISWKVSGRQWNCIKHNNLGSVGLWLLILPSWI